MNKFGQGKKEHKFTYTYKDISNLTGLKISTLRFYVYKRKFNPRLLKEVISFIKRYD